MNRTRCFGGIVAVNMTLVLLFLVLLPMTAAAQTGELVPETAQATVEEPAPSFAPEILEPADGAVVQPGESAALLGTGCEPDGTVAVRASQGTFFEDFVVTAGGDGSFAASLPIGEVVEPGQDRFTVEVSCGEGTVSVSLVVRVPRLLEITEPADGTKVRPGQQLTVSGTGCDPDATVHGQLLIGTAVTRFETEADDDGNFTTTVTLPGTFGGAREGGILIECSGLRVGGVRLVLEEPPPAPVLQITEPADGTKVRPGQRLTVSGTGCVPGEKVDVQLFVSTFSTPFPTQADVKGNFTTTVTLPGTFEGDPDGEIEVTCTGGTQRVSLVLEEPPPPPVLQITEPADGTKVRPGQQLTVRGTGCDANAAVQGQLLISDRVYEFKGTADQKGAFSIRITLPNSFSGDRDGELGVQCSGRNDRITLVLLPPPPELRITEPDNGDKVRSGQELTVRGQGCDPHANVRGALRISTFAFQFKATANADGVFAAKITLPKSFEGDRDGELEVTCSGRSDNVTLVLVQDGTGKPRQVPTGGVQTGAGGTAASGSPAGLIAAGALVTFGAAGLAIARRRGARVVGASLVLSALVLTLAACGGPQREDPGIAPPTGVVTPPEPTPIGENVALLASEPTRIEIPSIGVDSQLVTLGLNPDGTMEVPQDFALAGWYQYLPTPGERGPAIISGHIDSKSGPAVFFRLRELEPGAEIRVTRADGSLAVFRVDHLEQFPKAEFPTDRVYGDLHHAGLRLITCGGTFDRSTGHYRDNIVAYATLTATA